MKNKIKEVHDYFKTRIINGQFELTKVYKHTTNIHIDGYLFIMWTANEDYGMATYENSFMQINFTEADKKKMYKHFKVPVIESKIQLLAKKEKEIEKLKKEIGK